MADTFLKEQKLAAARKKLRKFQKTKARNANVGDSVSSWAESNENSSSRSSSIADVSDSTFVNLNEQVNSEQKSEILESCIKSITQPLTEVDGLNSDENSIINEASSVVSSHQVPYDTSTDNSLSHSHPTSNYSLHSNMQSYTKVPEFSQCTIDDKPNLTEYTTLDKGYSIENKSFHSDITTATVSSVPPNICDSTQVYPADINCKPITGNAENSIYQTYGYDGTNSGNNGIHCSQDDIAKGLEERNIELFRLLEKEKMESYEKSRTIEEFKEVIKTQETRIQNYHSQNLSNETKGDSDLKELKEQLKVHTQTIGILVSEKSELQSTLSNVRHSLEQKNVEISEVLRQLRAEKDIVRKLESSNNDLRNEMNKLVQRNDNHLKQSDSISSNYDKLNLTCDDLKITVAEFTEKLVVCNEEKSKFETELEAVRKQFDLSQVLIQQLRDHSSEDIRAKFEDSKLTILDLERKIESLKADCERTQLESKEMETNYKAYANQLATDCEEFKNKFNQKNNETLQWAKKIEELESSLSAKENDSSTLVSVEDLEREKHHLIQTLSELSENKLQLEQRNEALTQDNGQLSQMLSELNSKLEAFETAEDRQKTQEVDTSQLIQSMQSDKIAAARALSQNKQLKEQLEELQNGFMMMSNKKLELTEKLEMELHLKKELHTQISGLEEELSSVRDMLVQKQKEIDKFHQVESSQPPSNKNIDPVSHTGIVVEGGFVAGHSEIERVCETEKISNTQEVHNELKSDSLDVGTDAVKCIDEEPKNEPTTSNVNSPGVVQQDVTLRAAYDALESRFLKSMKEVANLSDEKQNLEHLVQQLQIETDTVGDYITIYQFQRGVMKQQMQELTFELELLKTEKNEMVLKINKLQHLFGSLHSDRDIGAAGIISGVFSIINGGAASSDERSQNTCQVFPESSLTTSIATDKNDSSVQPTEGAKSSPSEKNLGNSSEPASQKKETVKKIIDLINDIEMSQRLDVSMLQKMNPCPHCSGQLITV